MSVAVRPDSDVDRALRAAGGATLHYRSFAPLQVLPRPADASKPLPPVEPSLPEPPLSVFETAFVLELPMPLQTTPSARQPAATAPLADLFRTLGQPRHATAPR